MYRKIAPKSLLRNITFVLVANVLFISFCTAQRDIDIEAPVDLVLNCNNLDFVIINSWLQDYTASSTCDGAIEISNDFDGELPGLCGQPKFVKWIIRDECGGIDSSGSTLSLANDLFDVGFTICPNNITVFADTVNCGSQVIFPDPYARDCFSQIDVTQVRNMSDMIFQSGDEFPVGRTDVVFEATDECGNNDFCRFQIIVNPSEELVNTYCPENQLIRICASQDSCTWVSTDEFIRPGTALNDCGSATIEYSITTPTGVTTSRSLEDVDGNASGFVFPLGQSEVCYEIRNGGGSSECCFMVAIEDCTAPSIICPASIDLACDLVSGSEALDEWLGQAIVNDNCDANPSVRTIALDTMGTCGGSQVIEFLVIARDGSSNEGACLTTLNVVDDEGPELLVTRLPDSIFQCRGVVRNQEIFVEWLGNNAGFNDSHVRNNCPSDITWKFEPASTTFQVLNNACSPNLGFYDVEFYAEDRCGNRSAATARARLLVEDNLPPTLQIPNDIVLDCDIDNLQGIIDEVLSRVTLIDSCSAARVNASLTLDSNECAIGETVVDVTFTASDNCGNMITTVAQITLVKTETSLVFAPPPIVLRCGQNIDSIIPEWLDKFSTTLQCDSFTVVNTYDASMTDICGSVQQVIWLLQDTCGTSTTANSMLTIVDESVPPVFLNCPVDVTIFLDDTECSSLYVFDTPRAEDCTDDRVDIRQILPPNGQDILTSGSDFPIGETLLQFTATDQCNNVSRCEFTITVVDDSSCSNTGLSINGTVQDAAGNDFTGATLLIDTDGGEFPKLQISDASGDYSFGFLPPRQDYSIELSIEDSYVNGISGVDLLLIRNHILGLSLFESSLSVIAADANSDESLSALDIVVLQRLLIGLVDTLPNANAWKFVEVNEIENSTLIPWPRIDEFFYTNLRESLTQNFIAVKTGDVNASASPPGIVDKNSTEIRSSQSIKTVDLYINKGQEYELDFYLEEGVSIEGFQMNMDFTGLEILDVNSELFKLSKDDYLFNDRLLRVIGLNRNRVIEGSVLLQLKIKAIESGKLQDFISISNHELASEIYAQSDDSYNNYAVNFEFLGNDHQGLVVSQNMPNPFSKETTIEFEISRDQKVWIEIVDYAGKVLLQQNRDFPKGVNTISINSEDLDQSGILFFRISTGTEQVIRKMVSLR